jgi:hypothetical protein
MLKDIVLTKISCRFINGQSYRTGVNTYHRTYPVYQCRSGDDYGLPLFHLIKGQDETDEQFQKRAQAVMEVFEKGIYAHRDQEPTAH